MSIPETSVITRYFEADARRGRWLSMKVRPTTALKKSEAGGEVSHQRISTPRRSMIPSV